MKTYHTYQIGGEHQGLTVELYLKNILQYSGRKIQKLTRLKGIQLNKKTVFLQKKVKAGDLLSVLILEDKSYGVLPEEGPIEVLWEDSQVIILNKPPQMLVHPAGQTTQKTLANYLAYYFQQKKELVTIRPLHRLDRDTTGCIAFAKDAQTQTVLEQQLHHGTFKRSYYALVEGKLEPQAGTIDLPIGFHPAKPNRRTVTEQGERAITSYRTLKILGNEGNVPSLSLLELKLETGRTHQIRVHLAHVGHPVLGDRMYGRRSPFIARQALHACSIFFIHPKDGQGITVHAPIPSDLKPLVGDFLFGTL